MVMKHVVTDVFIVCWSVSVAIYKLRGYDDINVKTP